MSLYRSFALDADARDPLAPFRDRFVFSDETIYMDGNSLGRLPSATVAKTKELLEKGWGEGLVGGWHEWIDFPTQIGDQIAGLIGGDKGEVIVCDSTSVNLFKLAMAAVVSKPDRRAIVTDSGNFPSDQYVLQGVAQQTGRELRRFDADPTEGPDVGSLATALDDDVALVSLSHVGYRNASLADMEAITRAVHDAGALMLWDLCHSVGALPIDLRGCGVDLAVGCTYKYLNAGPGAPAFLYVRRELQEQLRQPIWGWFGQREQFRMDLDYDPEPGIGRFMVGTPPIVSMVGVEEGVRLITEAGIDSLRTKSIEMTQMMIALHDQWLAPLGVELASPREPDRRGSHLGFRHPEAYRICKALIQRLDVISDFREPDVIRYGVAPIYTSYAEAWDAMDRLRSCIAEQIFVEFDAERDRVT
ncbi:MAG TPA: kynureninase [Actinomycetota bacterium]|nr:kynureninase [Actinomycetota bacterium]